MKIRFSAALLIAALSITLFSSCATAPAAPAPSQPVLTAIEVPAAPLAPMPPSAVPAPVVPALAEAPAILVPVESNWITREETIAIALKDAGLTEDQVTRLHAEFDYDDDRPEYDMDFRRGNYEYDYEIHAESGEILSREKDRDD